MFERTRTNIGSMARPKKSFSNNLRSFVCVVFFDRNCTERSHFIYILSWCFLFDFDFDCVADSAHIEFLLDAAMFVRKVLTKKKATAGASSSIALDSSLTSIEWLPNMQIGENSSSNPAEPSTTVAKPMLPVTTATFTPKMETHEMELPTTTVHELTHVKPPFSYVTLIRQAILSASSQRMTLNEIYQWIVETYPYFRTAPPKWKVKETFGCDRLFVRLRLEFHSTQFIIEQMFQTIATRHERSGQSCASHEHA
jgi:hypothetical protein